jgi:hypothetical protein
VRLSPGLRGLTLQAGRSILINASITTDNGALTLIANDQLANGVVDSQRDPGNAGITVAAGTTLNTGTGALTVQLRDGAGKTNTSSGTVTLKTVTAATVAVTNNGPTAGSDIVVGPVTSSGAQTYANPNGSTVAADTLSAGGNSISFVHSVLLNASIAAGAVNFVGTGTQSLGGTGGNLPNLVHNGSGTLRLTSDLTVTGAFTNSSGTFDANGHALTVGGLTTNDNGTQYLGSTGSQTFGGHAAPAGQSQLQRHHYGPSRSPDRGRQPICDERSPQRRLIGRHRDGGRCHGHRRRPRSRRPGSHRNHVVPGSHQPGVVGDVQRAPQWYHGGFGL